MPVWARSITARISLIVRQMWHMGHQIVLPVTGAKLDLGPWEQVFYAEFDGQRRKRVVVKVMGL